MKIRVLKTMAMEVITHFDERTDTAHTKEDVFAAGDEIELDICDDEQPPTAREVQYPNGDVSFVTPSFWANVEILNP